MVTVQGGVKQLETLTTRLKNPPGAREKERDFPDEKLERHRS
jgi:hypothetical protein